MRSAWWAIAAGIAGIALAFFLFRPPDTGDDVPEIDVSPAIAAIEPGEPPVPQVRPSLPLEELRPPGLEMRPGANPLNAELLAQRNTPEALLYGRLAGPWTMVRRVIGRVQDHEIAPWIDELNGTIEALREARREPDKADWDALAVAQQDLVDRIRAAPFNEEEIESMLVRVEELLAEHVALGDAATEPIEEEQ